MRERSREWVSFDFALLRALQQPVTYDVLSRSGFGLYPAVVRSIKKHERLGLVVVSKSECHRKFWVLSSRGRLMLVVFGGKNRVVVGGS